MAISWLFPLFREYKNKTEQIEHFILRKGIYLFSQILFEQ